MKIVVILQIFFLINISVLLSQTDIDSLNSVVKPYPIYLSNVKFNHSDSTFYYKFRYEPLNMFGPTHYFFEPGCLDTNSSYRVFYYRTKRNPVYVNYLDSFIHNITDTIYINSNFSTFRTLKMPYKNTYDYDFIWTKYIFELENSFVHQNLNELPFDTTISSDKIRITDFKKNIVYRVTIYPNYLTIIYKEAVIDSIGQPKSFFNDTTIVEKKSFLKYIRKFLDQINFDKIDYFAINGLTQFEPCLFEIQRGKEIQIVRRNTSGRGEYTILYSLISANRIRYKKKVK